MITFLESLSSPYHWRLTTKHAGYEIAKFDVDMSEIVVSMIYEAVGSLDLMSVSFARGTTQSITGTGDQYRIFATVLDVMRNRIDEMKPDYVTFIADKEEKSRVSLYDKMVKRFIPIEYEVLNSPDELKDAKEAKYFEEYLKHTHDEEFKHTVLVKKEHLK